MKNERIVKVTAVPVRFQLQNRFQTSLGKKDVTRNVLVVIHSSGGQTGFGEASASLALPEATQSRMLAVIRRAGRRLLGRPLPGWQELAASLSREFPGHPTAISSLECALLDLHCRSEKIPLLRHFGRRNVRLHTHFTIPALPLAECERIIRKAFRQGIRRLKVKVSGRNAGEDFARLALAAQGGLCRSLIVDANQGWILKNAIPFLKRLRQARLPVTLVEQPLPRKAVAAMRDLRKRSPFPIAADESCRTLADAKRLVEAGAADVFNLKIAKSGLLESLRIARFLKERGRKLMLGCMMESAVGLSTSIHWAAGSGLFSFIDLDSFLLLRPLPFRAGFSWQAPYIRARNDLSGSGISLPQGRMPA